MKEDRRVFNLKLFLLSFKRVKLIGIISMALLLFVTVYAAISSVIIQKENMSLNNNYSKTIINISSDNSIMFLCFFIIIPLITLSMWNFLNKRCTSDFYHSLPYTRKCMFICNFLSITVWNLIIVFVPYIALNIVYALSLKYIIVDFAILFKFFLSIFLCNLLCSSSITVACMLTGTLFNNVCVSGLVIFLPRMIILIIKECIMSIAPFITSEHAIPLIGDDINMLFSITYGIFGYFSFTDIYNNIAAFIYTALLSAAYVVLACILFVKRESEMAEKSTSNKKMQFAIRVCIGFAIGITASESWLQYLRGLDGNYRGVFSEIIIVAFFVAAVIIIYECINVKNIRGIVTSLPSVLISYVMIALFVIILNVYLSALYSYKPDSDNIKWFTVEYGELSDYGKDGSFTPDTSGIKITDKKAIDIICNAYIENVEAFKNDYKYRNEFKSDKEKLYVTLMDGSRKIYRQVYVTKGNNNDILEIMSQNEEYRNAYMKLPDSQNAIIEWSFGGEYIELDEKSSKELYNTLQAEIYELGFVKWANSIINNNGNVNLTITYQKNGIDYYNNISISQEYVKTTKALLNKMSEIGIKSDCKQELVDIFEGQANNLSYKAANNVRLIFYDPTSQTFNYMYLIQLKQKNKEGYKQIVNDFSKTINDMNKPMEINLEKPYVLIFHNSAGDKNIDAYEDGNYENMKYSVFAVQMEGYDKISDYYRVNDNNKF